MPSEIRNRATPGGTGQKRLRKQKTQQWTTMQDALKQTNRNATGDRETS